MPRLLSIMLVICMPALMGASGASAQGILSNPSFEVGATGSVFGGWYEFGSFGSTPNATHGSVGARVSGIVTTNWEVSGYWQRLDTSPGATWKATAMVSHSSTNPLSGGSKAIVNIEWRDINENLISYETLDAATASTPVGIQAAR